MIVELRNGRIYYVLGNRLINNYGFKEINGYSYSDNMLCKYIAYKEYDIMSVYTINSNCYSLESIFNKKILDLIWEREEKPQPKEMTFEEIEKELGYSFKIVN